MAFSPDGRRIVSGSADKTLRLWEANSGRPIGLPMQGHTEAVNSVAFSPDGRRIVSGAADKTLRLWEGSNGSPIGSPLKGHTARVNTVAFSPNSQSIISGSVDYLSIRRWNSITGQAIGSPLRGHGDSVRTVAFSPDGRLIVSGSDDHTLRFWDASTGKPHTKAALSESIARDWRLTLPTACDKLEFTQPLSSFPWLNNARATCQHFVWSQRQRQSDSPSSRFWLFLLTGGAVAALGYTAVGQLKRYRDSTSHAHHYQQRTLGRDDSARTCGVLLHPTSLPGTPGSGSFGKASRELLDLLSRVGIGVWQVLPLAPTNGTGSPYTSPSGSALNPWLIDADDLLAAGLITRIDHELLPSGDALKLDPALASARSEAIAAALQRHWTTQSSERQKGFQVWRRRQRGWIEDHALFMVLSRLHQGRPWWEWPEALAHRKQAALREMSHNHQLKIEAEMLLQWQLDEQWQKLRRYARERHVRLFGDLPFYVAHDSADVWSRQGLFPLDREGRLLEQSGVPPDYFSATGRLWGTPVYRWWLHRLTRFRWWLQRLERQLELFDLLRLDYFSALEAFWSVPGGDATAENGRWVPSPGGELLALLRRRCRRRNTMLEDGRLPLIAEDLGVITPAVEALRDRFGLPGMKILQFAFDGAAENPYLPTNFKGDRWVVYTGTPDNATSSGWWDQLDDQSRQRIEEFVGQPVTAPAWQLVEIALASKAQMAVVPLQDLMELGDEARFNTPGTLDGNWRWRLKGGVNQLSAPLKRYGAMASRYGRRAVTS